MRTDFAPENPNIWEALYEKAITEPNPAIRRQRLTEAQNAILERAHTLDAESGEHTVESQALEEAANFVREMKLQTETDGVGMQLTPGDMEKLPQADAPPPNRTPSRSAD